MSAYQSPTTYGWIEALKQGMDGLDSEQKFKIARAMFETGQMSISRAATLAGLEPAAFARQLQRAGLNFFSTSDRSMEGFELQEDLTRLGACYVALMRKANYTDASILVTLIGFLHDSF